MPTHNPSGAPYTFAGGHVRADCVVYDLVADPTPHTDAVDARLLQMTLQYLEETGQAVEKEEVQGDAQDTVMEEWEYDYYELHEEEDSVYVRLRWCAPTCTSQGCGWRGLRAGAGWGSLGGAHRGGRL